MQTNMEGVIAVAYQYQKTLLHYLILYRMCHRQKDWYGYELIKGGIDGKSKEQAMLDELREEANIVNSNIRPLKYRGRHYTFGYFIDQPKNTIRRLMYVYLVKVAKSEKIQVNQIEHNSFLWARYGKALSLLKKKQMRDALKVVNNIIE